MNRLAVIPKVAAVSETRLPSTPSHTTWCATEAEVALEDKPMEDVLQNPLLLAVIVIVVIQGTCQDREGW